MKDIGNLLLGVWLAGFFLGMGLGGQLALYLKAKKDKNEQTSKYRR